MGYQRTGFVVKPRSIRILEAASAIMDAFKENLEKEVAKAVKSLTRSDTIRLTELWFERLLAIEHPLLDSDAKLRKHFIVFLADLLQNAGYIDTCPVYVDYITNPIITEEEMVLRMLDSRMPKVTADDLGGEFAKVDTLMAYLPEVIRRTAFTLRESENMTNRFRKWIGSIGYKLINQQPISQHELTAFAMYNSNAPGTPGHVDGFPVTPITAVENGDTLVAEVGALYQNLSLPGPFTNHQQLVSDGIREKLTAYFGLHNPDLKLCTGYIQEFGPFDVMDLTPQEVVPWTLNDQLIGITSVASNFIGDRGTPSGLGMKVPLIVAIPDDNGTVGVVPDDPRIQFVLTDERDISNFNFKFWDPDRGRWIDSLTNNSNMDLFMLSLASTNATVGACQIEKPTLEGFGMCELSPEARDKITDQHDQLEIKETFLLPNDQGRPEEMEVNVTPMMGRLGVAIAQPAFSEFARLPLKWFMQEDPRIVEHVASVKGLDNAERIRYAPIISIYHNVARFERITGKKAPLETRRLAEAILRPGNK